MGEGGLGAPGFVGVPAPPGGALTSVVGARSLTAHSTGALAKNPICGVLAAASPQGIVLRWAPLLSHRTRQFGAQMQREAPAVEGGGRSLPGGLGALKRTSSHRSPPG
jgi:hypothetical protein